MPAGGAILFRLQRKVAGGFAPLVPQARMLGHVPVSAGRYVGALTRTDKVVGTQLDPDFVVGATEMGWV